MTAAISFITPIFGDEYDGLKMRSLVLELERLHAEIVRSFDQIDTTGNEINDLSVIVTWANVPLVNIPSLPASRITSGTFADALISVGSVTQHEAAIDHDALTNFLAAEHVDWAGSGAGTIHTTNLPNPMLLGDGTAGAPAYSWSSDPDTGWFHVGSGSIGYSQNGTEYWRIGGALIQGVGIGGGAGEGPALFNRVPTKTLATVFPNRSDLNTGIGWAASGQLSHIAGGLEVLRAETISGSAQLLAYTAGTTAKPAYSYIGDKNTGVTQFLVDELAFVSGGILGLRLRELNSGVIQAPAADLTITAHAGGSQINAVALKQSYNRISVCATAGDSVKMPINFAVNSIVVIKNDGAESCDVFPGLNDDIGSGANNAIALTSGESITYIATAENTTWAQLVPVEANDLTVVVTWANVPNENITVGSVTQHVASIDHDALLNFLAAEHIDWAGASAGTIHASNVPVESVFGRTGVISATAGDYAGVTETFVAVQTFDAGLRLLDDDTISFGTGTDVTVRWDSSPGELTFVGLVADQKVNFLDGMNLRIWNSGDADYMSLFHDGTDAWIDGLNSRWLRIGSDYTRLMLEGGVLGMVEIAAAPADTASVGQLWTKNTTPNELWFTPDGGVDQKLASLNIAQTVTAVWDFTTNPKIDAAGIDTGVLAAARVATHTGDVTGQTALTIAADAVTYAKMQNVAAANRILGNVGGAGAIVAELTAAQVRTMINVEDNAAADQTSIVGISGTKAQFDTAVTDGNIAYVGGAHHDGFSDFLAAEHIDWAGASAGTIHASNVPVESVFGRTGVISATAGDYAGVTETFVAVQTFDAGLRLLDDDTISFGTGTDVTVRWDSSPGELTFVGLVADQKVNFLDGMNLRIWNSGDADYMSLFHDGTDAWIDGLNSRWLRIGSDYTRLMLEGGVLGMVEIAAAPADTASVGQLWTKNTTPNELWFTPDGGVDQKLASLNIAQTVTAVWDFTTNPKIDAAGIDTGVLAAARVATHTGDVTGQTALTASASMISGKSLVTAVASDMVLLWDASDSTLKRANVNDFLGGGGAVDSVFGRTGDVVALTADYAAFYTRPGDDEVITGDWGISGTTPRLEWIETDATADEGRWRISATLDQWVFATVNDAGTTAVTIFSINRTGNDSDVVAFAKKITAASMDIGGVAAATVNTNWAATDITSGVLAVLRGGTGVAASTGTGNNVLSANPDFTGTVDFAGNINLVGKRITIPSAHLAFQNLAAGAFGIQFRNSADAVMGYVYSDGSGVFGLLHSGGGWAVQIATASNAVTFPGNINAANVWANAYGAAGTPTHSQSNDTDSGFYGESSNVAAISTAGVRRLQIYASWAFFAPPIKTSGADTKPSALQSSLSANMLHIDGKETIDGNDTWLRLNQNGDFSSGIFSPGAMYLQGTLRVDGAMDINGNINCDGATIIDGVETIKIDSTGDITKVSHGNYLYHQSTTYDDDQEGGITFSTSAASGGADGDIWFRYTA